MDFWVSSSRYLTNKLVAKSPEIANKLDEFDYNLCTKNIDSLNCWATLLVSTHV